MKKNNSSRFPRESSWRSRPSVESKSRDTLSLSFSCSTLSNYYWDTRGEERRDRSRANGNSRKLSSVKIRNSPKALTPSLPSPFFLQIYTHHVHHARANRRSYTSCNHITDSSNEYPRREEKGRRRRDARWMPVLKPERCLPRIEITANGSTWQREIESPAVRGGGRKKKEEKRVAGNSFSMTKPYIGGGAIYRKSLATSDWRVVISVIARYLHVSWTEEGRVLYISGGARGTETGRNTDGTRDEEGGGRFRFDFISRVHPSFLLCTCVSGICVCVWVCIRTIYRPGVTFTRLVC